MPSCFLKWDQANRRIEINSILIKPKFFQAFLVNVTPMKTVHSSGFGWCQKCGNSTSLTSYKGLSIFQVQRSFYSNLVLSIISINGLTSSSFIISLKSSYLSYSQPIRCKTKTNRDRESHFLFFS